jgi:hypothetical protein
MENTEKRSGYDEEQLILTSEEIDTLASEIKACCAWRRWNNQVRDQLVENFNELAKKLKEKTSRYSPETCREKGHVLHSIRYDLTVTQTLLQEAKVKAITPRLRGESL